MNISKLTLGTAQLGQKYGIANTSGKPSERTSFEILSTAFDNGINCIDTAPVYGDSEEIIGKYLKHHPRRCTVITKLPDLYPTKNPRIEVNEWIGESIVKLQRQPIDIYMSRTTLQLDMLYGILVGLQKDRMIKTIGASIYTPQELTYVLEKYPKVEAFEIPINLFDHRFIPYLPKLKGKIVFARSIFLQGLMCLGQFQVDNMPNGAVREPLEKLRKVCYEFGTNLREASVSFVKDLINVTSLVIGAETVNQVLDNVELIKFPKLPDNLRNYIYKEFANMPLEIIDPRRWNV